MHHELRGSRGRRLPRRATRVPLLIRRGRLGGNRRWVEWRGMRLYCEFAATLSYRPVQTRSAEMALVTRRSHSAHAVRICHKLAVSHRISSYCDDLTVKAIDTLALLVAMQQRDLLVVAKRGQFQASKLTGYATVSGSRQPLLGHMTDHAAGP